MQPRLEGEFVSLGWALRHPGLASPLAYLNGCEVAPLVRQVAPGRTPLQIAQSWSNQIPVESGLAIVVWLFNHGILVGPANRGKTR